ncbi:MAG: fumarate hydratase C-terminal domain-containing protein [Candidatus Omnitrophota bacterium]|nr:MAG: fumarate hydratase C-terminal domain-containing protein [Candidatus Omnitrophota bacterium]
MMKRIKTPLKKSQTRKLKAGEEILLSGRMYTARDQAHKRLVELIKKGKKLPFTAQNQIIYYCGPTATPKGRAIGSCGPTTSSRMDEFVDPLLKQGLIGMVGKGRRSKKVCRLLKKYGAVYFLAPSGCGALLAGKVKSKKLVAFKELGPEAIYILEVENFPLIVGVDTKGNDIYKRDNTRSL